MQDHFRINTLFEKVSEGDLGSFPAACIAVVGHCEAEEHVLEHSLPLDQPSVAEAMEATRRVNREMADVIDGLRDHGRIDDWYASQAELLADLFAQHVHQQELALLPVARRELGDAGDPGASSDGDRSWASTPTVVEPRVDRSVGAVIQRTKGA